MSDKKHTLARPGGWLIVTDEAGERTYDTCTCPHCNKLIVVRPGSGTVRGWCLKCQAIVCGPECAECVPFEKKLDLFEKGKIDRL